MLILVLDLLPVLYSSLVTASKRSLGKGNVFTPVCPRGGGGVAMKTGGSTVKAGSSAVKGVVVL